MMTTVGWIVGAVVLLAAALVLVLSFARGRRMQSGTPGAVSQTWAGNGVGDAVSVRGVREDLRMIRDEIRWLHVMRTDLHRVGDLLERLLEETMVLQQTRMSPPRPEPAGGPVRDTFQAPVRGTRAEPSPVRSTAWRDEPRDFGAPVRPDELDWGGDPTPPPAPAWSAAAAPREPSANAVHVEASHDTVVRSERHPPEAWLERRGGDQEVWLNPRVALTDPALQRWSTFFDWERREPGARYEAVRPAVVTWSGSAGSVLRKGVARPV